jgi:hypothetical protein
MTRRRNEKRNLQLRSVYRTQSFAINGEKMNIKKETTIFWRLIKTWIKRLKTKNGLRSLNNRDLGGNRVIRFDVVQVTSDLFRI